MSHLKRTTRIHAPLGLVYQLTHDRRHWSDWYVGISDELDLDAGLGDKAHHRHVAVGAPFPLTQRVVDDHLETGEAHWHTVPTGRMESIDLGPDFELLMLSAESDWTCRESDGDTEVTVVLDFTVPSGFVSKASERSNIERMEAECVEQSLENLKELCEGADELETPPSRAF